MMVVTAGQVPFTLSEIVGAALLAGHESHASNAFPG
jgi:hypothetical protein